MRCPNNSSVKNISQFYMLTNNKHKKWWTCDLPIRQKSETHCSYL